MSCYADVLCLRGSSKFFSHQSVFSSLLSPASLFRPPYFNIGHFKETIPETDSKKWNENYENCLKQCAPCCCVPMLRISFMTGMMAMTML